MSQKRYIFTLKIIFKIDIKSIHTYYMILRFFVLDEYIIIIGIFVSSIKYTIILLDISNSLNENKIKFYF